MLLIAMCMGFYAATPDVGRQRQVYTTAHTVPAPAAAALPRPADVGTPRDSVVDNILLASVTAVTDGGPLPLAGAMAIPLLALLVRRRLAI
jgi:hypothetical protein